MSMFPFPQTYYKVTGTYVRGEWSPTVTGPFTFKGTIQPLNANDVKSSDAARREIGTCKVYSSTEMAVSMQGTANSGDHVLWQGSYWEIIDKIPNQSRIISHYKYIAAVRPDFVPPEVGE